LLKEPVWASEIRCLSWTSVMAKACGRAALNSC
jgi:hypothetical protein